MRERIKGAKLRGNGEKYGKKDIRQMGHSSAGDYHGIVFVLCTVHLA